MKKNPTIKEIAEIVGLSHVAVSKALRGSSDISPKTIEKVNKIASEIGYIPNAAARNLCLKKSDSIGIIVPTLEDNTAYHSVFSHVSNVAAALGLPVFLGISQRDPELETKHCQIMCQHHVGAIIIATTGSETTHIEAVCHNKIPIIYIGGKTDLNKQYSIFCNYSYSAELVVNYLYEMGHKKIMLFTYSPRNNTIIQKETGFTQAMQKLGLTPEIRTKGTADDTVMAGHLLVEDLMKEKELPTAIWCASDLLAISVMNALRSNSILVPEDISIIGHDDLNFASLPGIELTSLQTPMEVLGSLAVDLAWKLMQEEVIPEYHEIVLPRLVPRKTVIRCS